MFIYCNFSFKHIKNFNEMITHCSAIHAGVGKELMHSGIKGIVQQNP